MSVADTLRRQLQAQARQLLEAFIAFESFSHGAVRGSAREEPLRSLLSRHLPGRFRVGTGAVVSASADLGRQFDIIVADANYSLTVLSAQVADLFPVEAVHAVIEVQSSLGLNRDVKTHVVPIADRLAALRTVTPTTGVARYLPGRDGLWSGQTGSPVHTLVAYRGPAAATAVASVAAANDLHTPAQQRYALDFILVLTSTGDGLSSGYVVGYSSLSGSILHHYYPFRGEQGVVGPQVLHQGADSFSFWYAGLVNHLNGQLAVPPNLFEYLGLPYKIITSSPPKPTGQ